MNNLRIGTVLFTISINNLYIKNMFTHTTVGIINMWMHASTTH